MIELDQLSFAYSDAPPIFSDVSLVVPGGCMLGLTGQSGVGKSTLLFVVGLLNRPVTGTVRINGRDPWQMDDAARSLTRATTIGFVFQDAVLDSSRSVLDNVVEGDVYRGRRRREGTDRALELLAEFGVDLPPSRRPGEISGGQAQRVALCRALLGDPPVLLADEPTGNLDGDNAAVVITALRAHVDAGGVVIVATHDERVATVCDRVIDVAEFSRGQHS